MSLLPKVVAAWERFWFEQIPTQAYARLRVAFGLVGLISLYGLTPVSTYWTSAGLAAPAGLALVVRTRLTQHGLDGFAGWALFVELLVAFTLMVSGYWCRTATALAFFGTAVLARWNPLPLFGAHAAFLSLLFPLVWADTSSPSAMRTDVIWPLRLIRLQVCVIYLSSGLWKLLGETWRDGSALHFILNRNVFPRFPASYPLTLEPLLTLATYATLLWELSFAFCMLSRRTRTVALAIGVTMHLGMWISLEVGPFSFVMLAGYLAFVDPRVPPRIARFAQALRNSVIARTAT
jgi:hypothetical protein